MRGKRRYSLPNSAGYCTILLADLISVLLNMTISRFAFYFYFSYPSPTAVEKR
jgi:hypothetical protein